MAFFTRSKAPQRQVFEAADVFRAGATPIVTFIDRSQSKDYREIIFALRQQGRIVNFFGPSKSGKTVLCMQQVLVDKSPVRIHGGKIKSTQNFWELLAWELGIPTSKESVTEKMGRVEIGGEATVPLHYFTFGVDARKAEENKAKEKHFFDLNPILERVVEKALIDRKATIVIDDFHFVAPQMQTEMMNSLRDVLQSGNSVIIISVPEEAKNVLSSVPDLALLCTSVEAQKWSAQEIQEIGRKGFQALNLKIDGVTLRTLSRFAYRNPMLMQEYCARLCFVLDVTHTQENVLAPTVTQKQLEDVFVYVANNRGKTYGAFLERNTRRTWMLKARRSVNTEQLVFLALAEVEVMQAITLERLVTRMRRLLANNGHQLDMQQIREVVTSLSAEVEASANNRKPIKFDAALETIYILDPFFKAYLKWAFSPKLLAVLPSLSVTVTRNAA